MLVCYASHTGTKRNLAAMAAHGWHVLVSRGGQWAHGGRPYAIDNGAWADFMAARPFDGPQFLELLRLMGQGAEFIVVPDIVQGGLDSLKLSRKWLPMCREICPGGRLLIAVQDGMAPHDVSDLVGSDVGIFLGGSTEWKLSTMKSWGDFCVDRGLYYHVARVNTAKRMALAAWSRAHSVDGTSATMYAKTLPMLDSASRQADLFASDSTRSIDRP